ncbi:MAG: hypothetical protein COA99_13490, partial [Moraxellaceae bacterium]
MLKNQLTVLFLGLSIFVTPVCFSKPQSSIKGEHALAIHGKAKYEEGFTHFDYVNPTAPKHGNIVISEIGTFDSFNPFIIKGNAAEGAGYLYDTLMVASRDEPFTRYGLVAERIFVSETKDSVTFFINKQARFHDNTPITAKDIQFSFETLTKLGRPFYSAYYADVTNVDIIDTHTIKFQFRDGKNRELPLILSELVVLPAHYWASKDFAKGSLTPPLGSGPYKISTFNLGKD